MPDEAYFDGRIAKLAGEALRERKAAAQPFFLAIGFWKPHGIPLDSHVDQNK